MTGVASHATTRQDANEHVHRPGGLRHRAVTGFASRPGTRRVVGLVGTYPPTECGIATFTANVLGALGRARPAWDVRVVRTVARSEHTRPGGVTQSWVRDDADSLVDAVATLNDCDVALIQHEFGIFGGADGDAVVTLVRQLTVPVTLQLHTVLASPSANQYRVLQALLDAVDLVIVPSESAMKRLRATHRVARAVVVPHGAAANFSTPAPAASSTGPILTWGLLGPGKGIEHGIEAIAKVRGVDPAPTYVVAGHTHPNLVTTHGDPYRESLRDLVGRLGVARQVHFDNEYRDWASLNRLVRDASVVLLPYESRDQISSGVLVEALASGKPVVATRFPHAVEMLSGGAGILVDHGDTTAMARALERILTIPDEAAAMAARSRAEARRLLWPAVGETLARLLETQLVVNRAS